MGVSTEVLADVVAESLAALGASPTAHGGYAESLTSTERGLADAWVRKRSELQAGQVVLDAESRSGSRARPAAGGLLLADTGRCLLDTRDNCLPAGKVAISLDGAFRTNSGVRGSNDLEHSRSVQQGTRMAHLEVDRRRCVSFVKNRYDIAGAGLFLVAQWFVLYVISLVLLASANRDGSLGAAVIAGAGVLTLLFGIFSQGHLREGSAVKSDHLTGDAGYMLGVDSLVHYRVPAGERAVLAPGLLLDKGRGCPARRTLGRKSRPGD